MGPKGLSAILILALSAGAAHAQGADPALGGPGDPVHGQALFKQHCSICHQADKGAKNGVGPALYGAYGRAPGKAVGFTYSAGMKSAGFTWTPDKLNQWIQKPSTLVPGAKMVLAPVSAPQDRADIIAYLKTESTSTGDGAPGGDKPKTTAKKKVKKAES